MACKGRGPGGGGELRCLGAVGGVCGRHVQHFFFSIFSFSFGGGWVGGVLCLGKRVVTCNSPNGRLIAGSFEYRKDKK